MSLGIEASRRRLPELVAAAHRGETTVITRHGQPYAALVPVAQADSRQEPPISLLALKGCGEGLWSDESNRTVADLRDEW